MALGSITKTFTAAEVMHLAEDSVIELDSPASRYAAVPQVANGVTVRELLAQRASIPDPGEGPYSGVLKDLDRHWTVDEYLAPVGKATEKAGGRFYYDNTNFVLLGLVVTKASGRDVASAVRTDLWEPLGLGRLAWQDAQRLPPPLAQPGKDDLVKAPIPVTGYLPFRSLAAAVGAAGGVAGDAPSVARFGYELYGGHVLQPRSIAEMTDFDDGDGYGLGTRDFTAGGYARWNINAVGHDGSTVGYRSVLAVFRERHVSVAVLTPSTVDTVPYVQYLVKAGRLLEP
jgi:D-alanyl-D-alanine carboxypeptidase